MNLEARLPPTWTRELLYIFPSLSRPDRVDTATPTTHAILGILYLFHIILWNRLFLCIPCLLACRRRTLLCLAPRPCSIHSALYRAPSDPRLLLAPSACSRSCPMRLPDYRPLSARVLYGVLIVVRVRLLVPFMGRSRPLPLQPPPSFTPLRLRQRSL